jgi:hypothetical protein
MGIKQVQMEFQVAANDGVSAQVTITAGGTQVFSGPLAQTTNPLPGQVYDDATPFSLVEFDLEVENIPNPPYSANAYPTWFTPVDVTIAVSGGNICLQATEANYTGLLVEVNPPTTPATVQLEPGNADQFVVLRYATQPVWTPPATGRLDINDNVDTGPGSLLLTDNESVAYQLSMTLYSA